MTRNESFDEVSTSALLDDNITAITSDHTAGADDIVLADASGGALTVTLPSPDTTLAVIVKKTDASNTVTIATPGTETIDGKSSLTLSLQHQTARLVSDGTNYYTIGLDARTYIQTSEPTDANEGDVWIDPSA